MALREIVMFGEDILRKKCREVTKFDEKLASLLDDMAQTLYNADGVGLAAPQVGILRRVCIIDVRDGNGLVELINPEIIEQSGSQIGNEGCLSAPGEWCEVERPAMVTVRAFDRHGKEFTLKASELMARAVCHEVDHLDGILFTDRVKKTLPKKA
ncbi:MAG TPA: peptide deformylase [Ruminococcaceae bacterium]|nr:peptide deformylase [Oscillospiraceae bacterium]